MEQQFVFCCFHCGNGIIQNSRDHDECITQDGETWYCLDCHQHCPKDYDSDDENENENDNENDNDNNTTQP